MMSCARSIRLLADFAPRKRSVNTMTSNNFILIHPLRMHRHPAEAKNRQLQHSWPDSRNASSFVYRHIPRMRAPINDGQ